MIFEENTPITDTKEKLLSNLANKERFISQLVHAFQNEEIVTITADDGADTLIIQTVIRKSCRRRYRSSYLNYCPYAN